MTNEITYQASILDEKEAQALLVIARKALECSLRHEHFIKPGNYSEAFNEVNGVICTLHKEGRVRSQFVTGLPYPLQNIIDSVISAVVGAANENEPPVTADELAEIKIELTLLTAPQLLDVMYPAEKYFKHIIPGSDGVMLKYGVYESFLPPQAWKEFETKEEFFDALCERAGISREMWKEPGIEIYKFSGQIVKEQ